MGKLVRRDERALVLKRDRISAGPPPGWTWEEWAESLGTDIRGAKKAWQAARKSYYGLSVPHASLKLPNAPAATNGWVQVSAWYNVIFWILLFLW